MSENEATSDQDDVSFIRTDDMVCLQCSETGERVCLAAEGFGNRHCFLESIANRNYPPEMPSCVFVIEQALSVRALQEMVTAESGDSSNHSQQVLSDQQQPASLGDDSSALPGDSGGADGAAAGQTGAGSPGGMDGGAGGGGAGGPSKPSAGGSSGDGAGVGGGNRTLLYGHAVLLRHLHSGMYLATLSICSSSDKLAFDVGLKGLKEIGESCWWTVHPGSKQRSEGEKVRFGDDLILVSVATERYLHYTTTDSPVIPIPMASASASASAVTGLNQIGRQAIVNASFHSTHWSIAPFGTGLSRIKNVGYVFGGQVLRLLHGGDECLTISASTTSLAGESNAEPRARTSSFGQQQQQLASSAAAASAIAAASGSSSQQQQDPKMQQQQQTKQPTIEVIYEAGAVMSQARSLWRLDLIRTKWSGGFVQYSNALRIRHITTGKYLGVYENQLCLLSKVDASIERTAFCLRLNKDENKGNKAGDSGDDKDEEVIGTPMLKYGDSSFFIQHIDSQHWLSYRSYETKKRGIGRVEEKQAILSAEGKMDDCLEFCRSQEEEAKTARVIRKCDALFSKFIRILDHVQMVASIQKQTMGCQGGMGQLAGGGRLSFAGQGSAGDPDSDVASRLSRKRPSIAANSLAASAMAASINSGLAPLFLGSQEESGLLLPPSSKRVDFSLATDQSSQQQAILQQQQQADPFSSMSLFSYASQIEMSKCLEDLIDYFAQPEDGCDHEEEQNILRALRNRQDLFQEEGILNLILDAIDKINLIQAQGLLVLLLGEESSATWEAITGYFYQLLAAIIKDNHTNCAQFAQAHRLNWLFSRLSSQQASEGTGMLDVLHCVLVDSPEALNMLRESHIKVLISLLEKHGRDPKVLNVLCSLCVSNGVAIRSSQNTITNHLLPDRNLLLQTRLVDHVASMRPNVYVARVDGSAMYHRWYYEVVVDHIEMINNLSPHLRVGWANTKGYLPYPGGGSHWGANGVGDDFFSYAFDGQYLWSAGRPTLVRIPPNSTMTRQEVLTNQNVEYKNQQQVLLDSYASQQKDFVTNNANNLQSSPGGGATGGQEPISCDGLTSMANINSFTQSPYLRLQKNDVIGCLLDLSVPSIQFTINGKQIFGFFKNFNVLNGGLFHPVVSFSAKVSCRLLFGSNQGELRYRPPAGFSPLVEVLLPSQEITVEPCFSFGDLAKQVLSGPQLTADSVPQHVMDMIFIPRVIDTQSTELGAQLEPLRDSLAENMHELWCMSRIEDDWIYGDEHDDEQRTHPFICPYSMLPQMGKKYKLDLASQTLKTILSLGYKISPLGNSSSGGQQQHQQPGPGSRVKIYRLPNTPYLQSNGYKPAPLDLSSSELTPNMDRLVELLAENIHNIWAAEKINMKWTYRRRDVNNELADELSFAQADCRSCHLLPYKFVNEEIKLKNRQSALESVFTILAYNYYLEPPSSNSAISTSLPSTIALLDSNSNPAGMLTPEGGGLEVSSSSAIGGAASTSPSPGAQSPAGRASALGIHSSMQEFTGHETILNNAMQVGMRHYRAERTYAVNSGRWYYEVEVQTTGHIQVGWASLNFRPDRLTLGCDDQSWSFDCHSGRKVHNANYEPFGQTATAGQIIGCMLDLNDRTISYSLNGKLMLDSIGNELAFSLGDWPPVNSNWNDSSWSSGSSGGPAHGGQGIVPAISLGPNERVRLCFGQDVEQLRYFTDYGLQEGYQPFCVNMHKPITLWYNRREPNFVNLDELDASQVNIEVTRIPPGSDSPPALKIAYKQFESQERATWEYVRLSLPVTVNGELIDEADKIAKMQEIQAQQLRIAYSQISEMESNRANALAGQGTGSGHSILRHPARLEQHMLQSGFNLNDVKGLQRSYADNSSSNNQSVNQSLHQSSFLSRSAQSGQPTSGATPTQKRFHLLKTRSVDVDDGQQQTAPSLAVPSFTEAQRMMTATQRQQQELEREARANQAPSRSLLGRRNTSGSALAGRSPSGSLENLSKQEAVAAAASSKSTPRSRSTFKSIFGSMKSGGSSASGPGRSQSLSRPRNSPATGDQSQFLTVPKISIQTNPAENHHLISTPTSGSLSRSRNLSRSGSDLSISSKDPATESAGARLGGGLVRRLSRVGLGPSSSSQKDRTQADPNSQQTPSMMYMTPNTPPPFDLAQLDQPMLDLIYEYYYGVRIFPGQEPSHVLCGWVTSQFKHECLASLQDVQYTQIIQTTSLVTGQAEICERRECYLLNAGQLYKEMHPTTTATATTGTSQSGDNNLASGRNTATSLGENSPGSAQAAASAATSRSNRGMLIGCHVDASTGLLTFTVDGKPTKYKFQLEPQTKIYPGIFFQATTGDCLQFELSRTPLTLPLSAAILSLTPKHVQGQCPPRLKVQTLQTSQWSRVPNVSLRPNALKLSDIRGWSMLADNPLAMLVVHVPEDDRCLDVLELIEHERLLRFHSNTLILYGALCAQGNHKVAHIICSHVDQRQLLYTINSDYLSGDLRRGFADLLIALHLEFHAYGRHLTQNEFIVPITQELCQLYSSDNSSITNEQLTHSFSHIECVSIRTEMNMSPIGFDLSSIENNAASASNGVSIIKLLSTPYFPMSILKKLVFQALDEAVYKGNLPIRDLPGGSNANLFVPILKLADKLLLVGCITNQELAWLLSLIDPDTFERPKLNQNVDSLFETPAFAGLSFLAQGSNSPSSLWKPTILGPQISGHGSNQDVGAHKLSNSKGLLQMNKLDEQVKLAICYILHHLLDIQLRHRIESIMAFSVNFVGQLQTDQRRRYNEIKNSDLPSHLTARKTREFRCSPREQMRYILNFKNNPHPNDINASPSSEQLRSTLKSMHSSMMKQIKIIIDQESGSISSNHQHFNSAFDLDNNTAANSDFALNHRSRQTAMSPDQQQASSSSSSSIVGATFSKLMRVLQLVKMNLLSSNSQLEAHMRQQTAHLANMLGANGNSLAGHTELKFIKDIVRTVVKWAEESTIENKQLIRQMFHLLLRCYNGVGELIDALNNSYVIGEKSKQDVIDLLQVLSKVRALLAVQMGPAEEEVMRDCLWTLVNNVVFFQHPDLIRILRVHENVMHVMMNTLNKRSRQTSSSSAVSTSAAIAPNDQAITGSSSASNQQQQQQQSRQRVNSIQANSIPGVNNLQQQQQQTAGTTGNDSGDSEQEGDISKMVVSCCRFLCFFCRSSAKNQKAMFEHLGFILENSNILLSRPSLRGATPLDVACSSLMENHELVLALRESYLEKIAIYLSRCGLQSNQELIDKGYPDVGWDPVEGERYLDFLRFCVWVNGESVEENSNLVIRLLIRRPECLGPALRGEGPGLFAAIKDAISMADSIHADQVNLMREDLLKQLHQQVGNQVSSRSSSGGPSSSSPREASQEGAAGGGESGSDEDEINIGSAILNFYCALVDLLGRCAPDLQTIGQGKHESIRARSILKSLVPIQDLKSAISLRFALVNPAWSSVGENEQPFASTASSFMPNHKQSLVLFLERVYGIEDQATFFSLLEDAFLPDMRAATMLERPSNLSASGDQMGSPASQANLSQSEGGGADSGDGSSSDESENEMTLALNRYLGNSAIPLLIRESHFFKNGENYANLLEPTLHTVYRLSKVKILTKGQRESVSDFLIALTREMQPHQLLKLLRKLTVDVAVLNESTTVALRLLTLHYERCSKYYGYSGGVGGAAGGAGQTSGAGAGSSGPSAGSSASTSVSGNATEEERRLTMVLFTNIFDSLSLMDYDPELFENSLPCLNALACALPPDYSLTEARDFSAPGVQQQAPATSKNRASHGPSSHSRSLNKISASSKHGGSSQAQAQSSSSSQQPQNVGVGPYTPQPVDTYHVELDADLRQLAIRFSEHYHDAWASRKLDRDWQFGEQYSFKNKIHPRLRPYSVLTQFERDRYKEPIEEAMKALIAMGWTIRRLDNNSNQAAAAAANSRPGSRSTSDHLSSAPNSNLSQLNYELIQNYNPQPVDTSNLSLSRELQNLAERSAENAHDLWAQKQMEDWAHKLRMNSHEPLRAPILLHPLMVPYDLLTDKEKRKNRDRSQELLKYMLFEGYKVFREDDAAPGGASLNAPGINRARINSRAGDPSSAFAIAGAQQNLEALNKRRFAYSILNKLLGYTDIVMVKLELLKPSANFSRRSSFKQSDRDVKFFSKVVLPLIERYFTAHRDFFVNNSSPSAPPAAKKATAESESETSQTKSNLDEQAVASTPTAATGALINGCATLKEKEMLVTLFCKLAAILRSKLSVIGPDAKILVRCLQVLTRSIDAKSLSEQSIDFVRSSLLTFFNKTAQDLSQCVFNLKMSHYNEVRGATMRTSSSLYHIHLTVLPTLTALFDHLASSESGKYLLLDEIQVACQKILYNLYLLGTQIRLAKNHQFSRRELERHRHSYGNCLAAFAAAFPVAFLEPDLTRFNRYSSINTKRHQPIGGAKTQPPAQAKAQSQAGPNQTAAPSSERKQSQLVVPETLPNLPKLEELLRVVSQFVERSAKGQRDSASGGGSTGGSGGGGGSSSSVVGSITSPTMSSSSSNASKIPSDMAGTLQHPGATNMSPGSLGSLGLSSQGGVSVSQASSSLGGGSPADPLGQNGAIAPADNDRAIIEVIVPMLCSYLQFWYSQGPEAPAISRQLGGGNGCTKVVSKHLNDLLADIMNLIKQQVGIDKGQASMWLVNIAAHASQIINDNPNESSLLSGSFMPLSTKLSQRAENIYHREEAMRGYLKSAAEDTTAIEEKIQEEFHILIRDIYAFYPLLIKYSDYRKALWLKQSSAQASNGNAHLNASKDGPSQQQAKMVDKLGQLDDLEEHQSRPEQLLFHQVATVFDIWSNSQYFRREEQNFISQHEIDNMALIMQASNRPGRTQFQKSDPTQSSTGGRKKNKRRQGASGRRDNEREIASPLLVVALKRLLPIGMNLFGGRERELVQLVKERFLKKEAQGKIEELVRVQLTQPNKLDLSDEFCWQHYLYSRLGAQPANGSLSLASMQQQQQQQQYNQNGGFQSLEQQHSHQGQKLVVDGRIVARIVDMARVFHGLHIIDHPNLQQKMGRRSCVSTQRRRVVIACFRMTSLHSLPKHRAINFFLRSYCDTWLLEENFGQEKLIEDLTQTFEQAEQSSGQAGELSHVPRNDPLSQLIMALSRQATTEHGSSSGGADFADGAGGMGRSGVDQLYLHFAVIFRMSCGGDEEEEDEEGGAENEPDDSSRTDAENQLTEGDENEDAGRDEDEVGGGEADEQDDQGGEGDSDATWTIHEQEMEKQRLLFQQSRLSVRGVAEMILLYISSYSRHQSGSGSTGSVSGAGSGAASGGAAGGSSGSTSSADQTSMILSTLKLGISILRGGNVDVQRRMLRHLKDKKDVGFFTSIQSLMNSCSVLNLDAFERNQKAEALGVRSEGTASEKNMYDAEFTCKLFRFFQLLCEGHNLEFQNYLRTQAGNTTTVNVVISTVDYLLRLQESTMDFYWHYSSKELIDASGTENFIKAFKIAKQVFSTLTESIQGPCPQNQQALAHSRLWHAVGGFLFLFAHMQDKLSRNSSQLNLLIELLDLQKEMVIMMLSMLEGNVVNGTIGKQMVDTLVESSANVEMILKFFDMFLKLPKLTSATNFQEYDKTGSGWISQADLRKAMEQQKIYTPEEINYLLSCCEPNHDSLIDYREFVDRFHQPAKDISFNLAVLLTNLTEHITNEPRLQRFLDSASSVLKYFEPYLGRIEIMGSAGRIERVYFEIKESTLDQWAKPQIQESKRAFFFSIVTECDGKEKLEAFVNFCEDTIFEMQHATKILGETEVEPPTKAEKYPFDATAGATSPTDPDLSDAYGTAGANQSKQSQYAMWLNLASNSVLYVWMLMLILANHLRPMRMRRRLAIIRQMSYSELVFASFKLIFSCTGAILKFEFNAVCSLFKFIFKIMTDDNSLTIPGQQNKQQRNVQEGRKISKQSHPMWSESAIEIPDIDKDPAGAKSSASQAAIEGQQVGIKSTDSPSQLASQVARSEIVTSPTIMVASAANLLVTDEMDPSKSTPVSSDAKTLDAGQPQSTLESVPDDSLKLGHATATGTSDQVLRELMEGDELGLGDSGLYEVKRKKRRGIAGKLAQLANYKEKVVSFLARNFYTIKLMALVTAFIINFILLFFKVAVWTAEADEALAGIQREASSQASLAYQVKSLLADASEHPPSGQYGTRRSQLDAIQERLDKARRDFDEASSSAQVSKQRADRGGGDEDEDDDEDLDYDDRDDAEDEDQDYFADKRKSKSKKAKADSSRIKSASDEASQAEKDDDDDGGGDENNSADHNNDSPDNDADDEDDDDESTELVEYVVMDEKYYYFQTVLTFLASVHSILSFCMLIAYYHLKVPLVIFKREKEIARKLEFDGIYIVDDQDGEENHWTQWQAGWDKLVISAESFPVNYWDKFVKKRVREKYREQYGYEALTKLLGMNNHTGSKNNPTELAQNQSRLVSLIPFGRWLSGFIKLDFRYQIWKAGITLTDQSFLYQLFYLIFSLAGHYNYFFFAAHLLDVAFGFKKLRTILHSVTHNGQQLVLTVMLLTIVVYIYTVIAFNFFRKFYITGEEDTMDRKCHSMFTCFVYHIYQGVRAGGGIGDVIEPPDGDDYEFFRIAFDITFFFSVIVILLAIIQGLIIDAFGELRGQLLAVAEDMESNCFICGIGKDSLDKIPRGFETHVQKEHNLANYMFFLMHLINKPNTDYTGQETYVWELYERRCWNFFPVGECFRTQSEEEGADVRPASD